MATNSDVLSLLNKNRRTFRMTTPDASCQTSPAERPHEYIGETVRSLMEIHDVPLQLCPYAISHYIKVHGLAPHEKAELSPDEQI